MLVLSRREQETIVFPSLGISVEIIRAKSNNVRLGIRAPREIRVIRGELAEKSDTELISGHRCETAVNQNSRNGCEPDRLQRTTIEEDEFRYELERARTSIESARNQLNHRAIVDAQSLLDEGLACLQRLNDLVDGLNEVNLPGVSDTHRGNRVQEANAAYRIQSGKHETQMPETRSISAIVNECFGFEMSV